MNAIKTGFIVAVLVSAGYGVHLMLSKSPQTETDDVAEYSQWGGPIDVDLGEGAGPLDGMPTLPELEPGVPADAAQTPSSPNPASVDQERSTENTRSRFSNPTVNKNSIYTAPHENAISPENQRVESGPNTIHKPDPRSVYAKSDTGRDRPETETGQTDIATPPTSKIDSVAPATLASRTSFADAWDTAQNQILENRLAGALFTLSLWYDNLDLKPDDRRKLVELLDQLAGAVIYSKQHTMEPPYPVRKRQNLYDISNEYKVPWRLLARINSIRAPQVLVPGQELKVVRGPFRAEIDLTRQELTMFIDRYYAGRFAISTGNDPPPRPGSYEVLQKKYAKQNYFTPDGNIVAAEDPTNPYGKYWIGLSKSLSIHGSPVQQSPYGNGCVSLSPQDAEDVYAILSRGSRILIKENIGLSSRVDSSLSRQ